MSFGGWLGHQEGIAEIDRLGSERTPFLFVLSYDKQKIYAKPLDRLDSGIFYKVGEKRNYTPLKGHKPYCLHKSPIDYARYKEALEKVQEHIRAGNTYLLNLTFETPIETDLDLREIFDHAKAKFKLYFRGDFICFSPEIFISITGNTIATYPMKGTIEASLPDAAERILADSKEMAEHVMIVDLMRNDLGIVAEGVRVEEFRYIDRIVAGEKDLLQVSSRITATLTPDWHGRIGTLLDHLTPAGSISGTPKRRTLEIIEEVEGYERGFYTGVFGLYDGESLSSGVMIRFIESREGKLCYKSGGGITLDSDAGSEYRELVDKVYLPI